MSQIKIGHRAEFTLTLTLTIVSALIHESQKHYDGVCRGLSGPDGLLTRWGRILASIMQTEEGEPEHSFTVTFRELDTLAKTCEMARDNAEAQTFMMAAMRAMHYANEHYKAFPIGVVKIGAYGNPPAQPEAVASGECGRCGSLPGSRDETCPDCTNPDGTPRI